MIETGWLWKGCCFFRTALWFEKSVVTLTFHIVLISISHFLSWLVFWVYIFFKYLSLTCTFYLNIFYLSFKKVAFSQHLCFILLGVCCSYLAIWSLIAYALYNVTSWLTDGSKPAFSFWPHMARCNIDITFWFYMFQKHWILP